MRALIILEPRASDGASVAAVCVANDDAVAACKERLLRQVRRLPGWRLYDLVVESAAEVEAYLTDEADALEVLEETRS